MLRSARTACGMKVVTVTPAVRAERNIQSDHGALIYDLPDDMEEATGLRSGDVILQINRVRVASAEDLRRAFAATAGARPAPPRGHGLAPARPAGLDAGE